MAAADPRVWEKKSLKYKSNWIKRPRPRMAWPQRTVFSKNGQEADDSKTLFVTCRTTWHEPWAKCLPSWVALCKCAIFFEWASPRDPRHLWDLPGRREFRVRGWATKGDKRRTVPSFWLMAHDFFFPTIVHSVSTLRRVISYHNRYKEKREFSCQVNICAFFSESWGIKSFFYEQKNRVIIIRFVHICFSSK